MELFALVGGEFGVAFGGAGHDGQAFGLELVVFGGELAHSGEVGHVDGAVFKGGAHAGNEQQAGGAALHFEADAGNDVGAHFDGLKLGHVDGTAFGHADLVEVVFGLAAEEVGEHVGKAGEGAHADDGIAGNHALDAAGPGFGMRSGKDFDFLKHLVLIFLELCLEVAEAFFTHEGKFLHLVHGTGHAHVLGVDVETRKVCDGFLAQMPDASALAEFSATNTTIQGLLHASTRLLRLFRRRGTFPGTLMKKEDGTPLRQKV